MEVLVTIAALATFAWLAARFGHDSRDGFHSKEQSLTSYDGPWRATNAPTGIPNPGVESHVTASHAPLPDHAGADPLAA